MAFTTGQEMIEEIENPELTQNRVKEYYELKGIRKIGLAKDSEALPSDKN